MMTYKETLLFIGKCLTISHEEKNKLIVEEELKLGAIDWDAIVKLSTKHYVFPALYCNLKRADFLHYLPEELVNYMIYITDLNRERNQQIIAQAKEINELLLSNNITPIFLKGVGNLLEGLYEDIAERMLSDIDFLVPQNKMSETISILKEDNYYILKDNIPESHGRHYPKLVSDKKIASVEVHREMLRKPHHKHFNYDFVKKNFQKNVDKVHTLSYQNQIALTILSRQVNDYGYFLKHISLRANYDVFLLSRKTEMAKMPTFSKLYSDILNSNLAVNAYLFNNPKSIHYKKTSATQSYLNKIQKITEDTKDSRINAQKTKIFNIFLVFKRGFFITLKTFYKREYVSFFWSKISSIQWYKERFFNAEPKA